MRFNTCCFTGSRPQSLPWGWREEDPRCSALKERMEEAVVSLITQRRVRHFISGGAQGVDTYAGELVLGLKPRFPGITLEIAIPMENQDSRWSWEARSRYAALLSGADRRTYVCRRYSPDCFHRRNRYMVEHSAYVLAVWDGRPGGTAYTVEYARQKGRELLVLDPERLCPREA